MAVVIKIEEGPQTLVGSVRVAGKHNYPGGSADRRC